jgi:3D (Asp-Asp-Asp) domain-containing protein
VLHFGHHPAEGSRVLLRTNLPFFAAFVWYGPALVETAPTRSTLRLAGILLALALGGVSVAAAARPGDSLRTQVSALDTRTHRALLELYALDSRLHAAEVRASSLEVEMASLRREQLVLSQQLGVTRHTLVLSQRQLGKNLSLLYKEGDVSALAVVLGSSSLDDALTRLDALNRVVYQSEQVVLITTNAKSQLGKLCATLSARRARLDADLADARANERTLAAARNGRLSFISGLRREARFKTARIRDLEATAQRVVDKSDELAAVEVVSQAVAPAVASARTIVVSTTGYSLSGRTATGMPVGRGVVAVDPSVIPLGTRLSIPGYGEAVAADVGGAVRGNTIDLWFPTLAQARAWGRRTVTIALH